MKNDSKKRRSSADQPDQSRLIEQLRRDSIPQYFNSTEQHRLSERIEKIVSKALKQ
jgi:hypothetical protein